MKHPKKITKEHVWLSCMIIGPITSFLAVFSPSFSILAIIFMVIGIKGVLVDVM
jgi:membrane-bound ClpP family serine protease